MRSKVVSRFHWIIIYLLVLILLSACGREVMPNDVVFTSGSNKQVAEAVIVESSVPSCLNADHKLISDDEFKGYVFCLIENERYSDVIDVIKSRDIQAERLYEVLSRYAEVMGNPNTSTDVIFEVQDAVIKISEEKLIDLITEYVLAGKLQQLILKDIESTQKRIVEAKEEEKEHMRKYREKFYDPEIGMTVEQVEKSQWGKPKDINKTTTKYGVHEQWVYYGRRYVYFEDGIVTSIQE